MRVISYGGGVQSTALIVLAVQGRIEADVALFANVGADSEHPATIDYVRRVITPWAAEHRFQIHELHRAKRDGTVETLRERIMRPGSRSIPFPARMPDTGAPGTRQCSHDFKTAVVGKWLRQHGGAATVLIGFSTDEMERVGRGKGDPMQIRAYPLLDLGMSRQDCVNVIQRAGLPVPPKSACYFCPYHRPQTWAEMRRDEPVLFADAQLIEDTIGDRREVLGKDRLYLTRFGKRLSEAIPEAQADLWSSLPEMGEDGCDEGVCFV